MRLFCIALCLVILIGFSYPVLANDYIPGEIIVKYKSSQNSRILSNSMNIENTYIIKTGNTEVLKAVDEYRKRPDVLYAEPNYIYRIELSPNDTSFSSQYHHTNIQSENAWNITTGTGVVIAIIDTGVAWNHSDISSNIWNNTDENCIDGIDNDANGYIDDCRGWDFVNTWYSYCGDADCNTTDNNPMDDHGHGTHVAGIAAAVTNNSLGISGVCWNCKIMPLRAGYKTTDGDGILEDSDISLAIRYAADNGAKIISMSFGGADSSTIREAVQYAYSRGVVLIASAGNTGDGDTLLKRQESFKKYPAAYDEVIAIGSTTSSDARSSFSSYGAWVDLSAPGSLIYSTYLNDSYATFSGTSMAAPLAAGVAGLVLSKNTTFTNEQVRTILKSSVNNFSSSQYQGTGRINAFNALVNSSLIINLNSDIDYINTSGILGINGTANGTYLTNLSLYYGSGFYPTTWTLINISNISVSNSSIFVWNTTEISDDNYTIRLESNDSLGQLFFDTTVVIIDNIPRVNITYPNNNSTITESSMIFNATISEIPSLCSLEYDGINYTMNISGALCYLNKSLTSGTHIIRLWAKDLSNKLGYSNVTINTDSDAPSLIIQSPANNTIYETNNLTLNYTTVDINLQSCKYILDNSTNIIQNCINVTLSNMSEGLHTLTIYANDTLNNTNTSSIIFRTDLLSPIVQINSPANNSIINSTTINITANDANLNYTIISFISNLSIINSSLNTTNGTYIITMGIPDGVYNITATIYDMTGKNATTTIANITFDAMPEINFALPTAANGIITNNNTLKINITFNETNLRNLTFYLYNSTSLINTTISNQTFINYTLQDGTYYYNVTIQDSASTVTTPTQSITIDTTTPYILSHAPSTSTLSSATITITTNENATCRYSTTLGTAYANMTDLYTGNDTSHTLALTGLTTGSYTYYTRCNDTAGNVMTTDHSVILTVTIGTSSTAGGGGSASSTASYAFDKIVSGATATVNNNVKDSGISTLEITTNAEATSVSISIQKLTINPVSATVNANAYKYISVNHNILESKFASVNIKVDVEKTWIDNNSIDESKIYLERYETSAWKKYSTIKIGDNGTHITYQATVPGLSYFAISGDKVITECTSGKRCDGKQLQECVNKLWVTTQTCADGCDSTSLNCTGGVVISNETTGPECTTGSKQCVGNDLQLCVAEQWTKSATCELGCNVEKLECNTPIETPTTTEIPWSAIIIVAIIAVCAIAYFLFFRKSRASSKTVRVRSG